MFAPRWELLTDFLNAGRDLAVLASEPCPLPVPPSLPQLPPDEGRPAYQRELPGMPATWLAVGVGGRNSSKDGGHRYGGFRSRGFPNKLYIV
jgi:hypothetical protein